MGPLSTLTFSADCGKKKEMKIHTQTYPVPWYNESESLCRVSKAAVKAYSVETDVVSFRGSVYISKQRRWEIKDRGTRCHQASCVFSRGAGPQHRSATNMSNAASTSTLFFL